MAGALAVLFPRRDLVTVMIGMGDEALARADASRRSQVAATVEHPRHHHAARPRQLFGHPWRAMLVERVPTIRTLGFLHALPVPMIST